MFKGNMSKILKQAQDMQKKMENVQNELSDLIVEADSGGGMITVKVNGNQEILELNIDQEAQNEEKEVLEDLIISAINKAITLVKSKSQDKMNSVTGGLASGLKIPGMLLGKLLHPETESSAASQNDQSYQCFLVSQVVF